MSRDSGDGRRTRRPAILRALATRRLCGILNGIDFR